MEFLAEDPTYLAGGLGVLAMVFLVLLRTSQQGKYLMMAGAALGLAVLVVVIERAWVTESERIEAVVYGLAEAVEDGDGDRAAEYLDPSCRVETKDRADRIAVMVVMGLGGRPPREWLRGHLGDYRFQWVRIARLRAHAGAMTGLGTAEFVVHAMPRGDVLGAKPTPPTGMGWSLGFREVAPHVWKVVRISPGRIGAEE